MKAVVLAAGRGERLRPMTDRCPKALVPFCGRPLLEHLSIRLQQCKVTAVGINSCHCPDAIDRYLAETGRAWQVSRETAMQGTAGGLAGLRDFLAGSDWFLLHNGDILSDLPLAALAARYAAAPVLAALVVHDCPGRNNVALGDDDRVVDLRGQLQPTGPVRMRAYTGVTFLRADFLRLLSCGPGDLVDVWLRAVRAQPGAIVAYDATGCCWADVGTPTDYLRAHAAVLQHGRPLIPAEHQPGGACVADAAQVAGDVVMRGFVHVGAGAVVGASAELENCVIWPGSRVPAGARISSAIVGPDWQVAVGEAVS